MEVTIALPCGKWHYDTSKPLGNPGGFGAVFHGRSEDGKDVAVKRLKIDSVNSAYRELRIANLLSGENFQHVLPYFDAGQDANSDRYYVVMPVATQSLADYLNIHGLISELETISILNNILAGLIEVGELVHRDLKPSNILYYNNRWQLADFGIAKFVEESTSLKTLKECLSPPFAAPEQWLFEKPTHTTDIYALGCIGYYLLTNSFPFPGPLIEDFKKQHLSGNPPDLNQCSNKLKSLLSMMLRKSQDARPNLDRVRSILNSFEANADTNNLNQALESLAEAGTEVATANAKAEAIEAEAKDKWLKRRKLANEAEKVFINIRNDLFKTIMDTTPVAICESEGLICLGDAQLSMLLIGDPNGYPPSEFKYSGWDVVMGGIIVVHQAQPIYKWSSSLWYTKLFQEDEYRWREISYFNSPLGSRSQTYEPFALQQTNLADVAASNTLGVHSIAFGPVCIDDEDFLSFQERWSDLFTKAVRGQLSRPSNLPLTY